MRRLLDRLWAWFRTSFESDARRLKREKLARRQQWELQWADELNRIKLLVERENLEFERRETQKEVLLETSRERSRKRDEAKKKKRDRDRRKQGLSVNDSLRIEAPQDADDFELVCAKFMLKLGHVDVKKTAKGPDGGVDVISSNAVGQSKFHPSQKVSAEPIKVLYASMRIHKKKKGLFFAYGPGYTLDAIDVAKKLGVELYLFEAKSRAMRRIL